MRKFLKILWPSVIVAVVFIFGFIVTQPGRSHDLSAAAPAVKSVVEEILAEREASILATDDVPFGSSDELNILALGIDSRKEGNEGHCDSIHMITLNLKDWSIQITSVPRGTYSTLPPGRAYLETDYYLSNACAFGGLDYGIVQIEKVVGVKADYVVKVGFSEALGLFRALDLPTTETLQWLRSRHAYAIGDPQRQHNQALFMKDMTIKLLKENLSSPFLYILYRLVDTDMDFKTVKALYTAYYAADLAARPDDITLDIKPHYDVTDIHYNPDSVVTDVQGILDYLDGKISTADLSSDSIAEVQTRLVEYLRAALADEGTIVHVYDEQMWRQVEDTETREELHFRFLDKYVREIKEAEPNKAVSEVTDYVLEMQYFGQTEWEEKGRRFLESLTK